MTQNKTPENIGNAEKPVESVGKEATVSGGKIWKPKKFWSDGIGNILAPILFFLMTLPLYLIPDLFGEDNVDEWVSMTESLWLKGERDLTFFYVSSIIILLINFVPSLVARRSAKFWKLFGGITIPVAIVSIILVTWNPFQPETSKAEEWAEKHYGYTLLEEPRKGYEVIDVRTSDGVEKQVNVVEFNDHIYLTDDDTTSGKFFIQLHNAKEDNG